MHDFKIISSFTKWFAIFLKDPGSSYDINDEDDDPQPRYDSGNTNRYVFHQDGYIMVMMMMTISPEWGWLLIIDSIKIIAVAITLVTYFPQQIKTAKSWFYYNLNYRMIGSKQLGVSFSFRLKDPVIAFNFLLVF